MTDTQQPAPAPRPGSLDGDPMVRWLILYVAFGLALGFCLGVLDRRPVQPLGPGAPLVTVYATFRAWPLGASGAAAPLSPSAAPRD